MCVEMKDGIADESINSIERMPVEMMHTPVGAGYRNAIIMLKSSKVKSFKDSILVKIKI